MNQDIVVGGTDPDQVINEVQVVLSDIPSEISAFRLDVFDENGTSLDDVNGLPTGGPGRAPNGNFVLTHVTVNFFYVIRTPQVDSESATGSKSPWPIAVIIRSARTSKLRR